MSAPLQLALGGLAEHRNHYLFSDHYLDHLLPADPRWHEALPACEAFVKALAGSVQGLSGLVGVYRAHAPTS